MATGKRYYWIKLKEDFFADDGPADFLMSQTNGADYVVLYQMLCLKTINTSGRLSNQIGEVIIPYDVEKIRRTCKYFSVDTIRVALNLYMALGLVYEDKNGILVISEYDSVVGSETDWAEKKRRQISRKDTPDLTPSNRDDSGEGSGDNDGENFPIDIRDKRLDIRDKDIKSLESNLLDSDESNCRAAAQRVIEAWNSLPVESKVQRMSGESTRAKCLNARLREYGLVKVLQAVEMVRNSDFLLGRKTDFQVTFDWFVKPNNFAKVVSGNYNNRKGRGDGNAGNTNNEEAYQALLALQSVFGEEQKG